MRSIDLGPATLDLIDTRGDGRPVVLLHGLLMDASLWAQLVTELAADHRCIAPVLPLGAHTRPTPDADLSMTGIARLVADLLDRLDLRDVVLVGNDTGGALVQLVAVERAERVAAIVLVSCDAFDNFPPGLTGKTLVLTGKLAPRLFGVFMQQMRLKPVRRLPIAFGWLTRRGDGVVKGWIRPILTSQAIRRDMVRVLRGIRADRGLLVGVADRLPSFDRPALVVWASGDRVMPPEHGRRLADLLPQGHLVEVADSSSLIPLDQPMALATALRAFTAALAPA